MSPLAIEVKGLRKTYGTLEAVRGIDLSVSSGEVFAMLGPNGAGKTTTVEILEGHRTRTAGEVSVLGFDPGKKELAYKQRIGIVLQETGVERFLKVWEVIELFRGYYPNPRPVDEVIEVVGLREKRDERVGKLSGGQQRRLDVAIGLAGDPDLLFLDEPTTGFDPSARRNAWKMIENLKSLGKTVFLTTHYMDEAQHLSDRVAIIVNGRIVAEGSPQDLASTSDDRTTIEFTLPVDAPRLPEPLRDDSSGTGGRVLIQTSEPMRYLHDITGWALEQRVDLLGLRVSRPSLEDVYLILTSDQEAREGAS
jgi:ABC-2 type transport system ATP-binding protein